MQQRWDCEKFKQSDPNNFDMLGEQFIKELQINVKEINILFNTQQFAKSLIFFTEIICQSKIIYAIELGDAATNLKIYLDEYMEEIEGITYQKKNFQFQQQKEAALQFINFMDIASETINEWYQYKNLSPIQDLFQEEIKQIKETYDVLQNQNCSFCQLI